MLRNNNILFPGKLSLKIIRCLLWPREHKKQSTNNTKILNAIEICNNYVEKTCSANPTIFIFIKNTKYGNLRKRLQLRETVQSYFLFLNQKGINLQFMFGPVINCFLRLKFLWWKTYIVTLKRYWGKNHSIYLIAFSTNSSQLLIKYYQQFSID